MSLCSTCECYRTMPLLSLGPDDWDQIAGPMWSGPLHDKDFVGRVLQNLEASESNYGTATRMKGMLTIAKEVCSPAANLHVRSLSYQELDVPFYFTPAQVSSAFHCVCPSLHDITYVFTWIMDHLRIVNVICIDPPCSMLVMKCQGHTQRLAH